MTLGGPSSVPVWPCPKCGVTACSMGTGGCVICASCYAVWVSEKDFDNSSTFSVALTSLEEEIKQSKYIESGQLKQDIEDVIALAEERAAVQAVLQVLDKLEYDVRKRVGAGVSHSIVESALAEARKEWYRVNGNG